MHQSKRNHLIYIGNIGRSSAIEAMHNIRKINIEKYNSSPKLCKLCGCSINYDKRRNSFCSHKCAAIYSNHNGNRPKKRHKYCIICKKEIFSSKTKCRNCYKPDRFMQQLQSIEHQMLTNTVKYAYTKFIKFYLIYKRGHKCECCNNTLWNNKPIPLDCHHIDGDYLNNHPNNLQLLCKNCHGLTDNYGAKNKQSTKPKRNRYV